MYGEGMNNRRPVIQAATWAKHEQEIRSVRHPVFVLEQAVPEDLDFDGEDATCYHALALSGGKAVGTGRVQSDGHIGRIAVLRAWRGQGIGSTLVQFLADAAKRNGVHRVYLNAQVPAVGFYEKLGFRKTGDIFLEAGIEHIKMVRESIPTTRTSAGT